MATIKIDCESCIMKDLVCSECVVQVMLNPQVDLDESELLAIEILADRGMVPTLKMRGKLASGL